MSEQTQKAYCLFCRTGDEQKIAAAVNERFPQLQAMTPLRILAEKRQGKWEDRTLTLLPGYVFVYADDELPYDLRYKTHNLYKVLHYERGIRALTGPDADYAGWLFRHRGRIGTSKVLEVGSRIEIVDGPLKDFGGKIVKLDKHKRRAWIEFDFEGSKRTVSISADCLQDPTEAAARPERVAAS